MASLISKENLEQKLSDYPLLYAVAKFIYIASVSPPRLWKSYRQERFRKKCYAKFESGKTILSKSYGKIKVRYEAISPQNYWHLAIGSQYEDKFMHIIFEKCTREGDIVLDIALIPVCTQSLLGRQLALLVKYLLSSQRVKATTPLNEMPS